MSPYDAAERLLVDPADVEREAQLVPAIALIRFGLELDLADRGDRPVAGGTGEPFQLEDALGEHERRVEPEAHRRRTRMICSSLRP